MREGVQNDMQNSQINGIDLKLLPFFKLQMHLTDVAIPHQSQIGFEEPICDSFPPGEAFGTFLNCKINYNLKYQVQLPPPAILRLRLYSGLGLGENRKVASSRSWPDTASTLVSRPSITLKVKILFLPVFSPTFLPLA